MLESKSTHIEGNQSSTALRFGEVWDPAVRTSLTVHPCTTLSLAALPHCRHPQLYNRTPRNTAAAHLGDVVAPALCGAATPRAGARFRGLQRGARLGGQPPALHSCCPPAVGRHSQAAPRRLHMRALSQARPANMMWQRGWCHSRSLPSDIAGPLLAAQGLHLFLS